MTEGIGNGNGNDQGKFVSIKTSIPAPGYLVIRPGTKHRHAKEVPVFLSHTLIKWAMEHPECRVRNVVGTVEAGQTVLLQVWHDEPSKGDRTVS